MEIVVASEIFHSDAITSEIGGVAHVEGHVEVAQHVDEYLHSQLRILKRCLAPERVSICALMAVTASPAGLA